jgi:hypothetical protein
MQYGIADNKLGLVKHREGFYCVGNNPDLIINGVRVIRIVRKPVYPTFVVGIPAGIGFGTTEVILTQPGSTSIYNTQGEIPILKRY